MVEGLARVENKLRNKIPRAAQTAARDALSKGAAELVKEMQRLAPHDTGMLRNSITWEWGGGRSEASGSLSVSVTAGDSSTIVDGDDGERYQLARLQEFGTRKMSPNPFFLPAYRNKRKSVKSRITREVRKAIKQAWGSR